MAKLLDEREYAPSAPPPFPSGGRLFPRRHAPLLLLLLCSAVCLSLFPKWTVDDAYISFRYARHLALHGQLTWNVGEPPVEGYTGVALPVVLALTMRLGLAPEAASKWIGIAAFYACGFLLYRLLARFRLRAAISLPILSAYLLAPMMFVHAWAGLETLLFSALVLASFDRYLAAIEPSPEGSRASAVLAAALFLATMVRPEGIALATILTLFLYLLGPPDRAARSRIVLTVIGVYALPLSAYVLWKQHYYGSVLPNTYYAKQFAGIANPQSAVGLVRFLIPYLGAPFAVAVLVRCNRRRLARPGVEGGGLPSGGAGLRCLDVPLALFALSLTLAYLRSELVMGYANRFWAPLLPLLLLRVGVSIELDLQRSFPWAVSVGQICGRAGPILVAAQALIYVTAYRIEYAHADRAIRLLRDQHAPAAAMLARTVPLDQWLVVCIDAGYVPYRTGLKTLDFGKLNDAVLARGRLTDAQTVDYFYRNAPAAIMFTSTDYTRPANADFGPIMLSILSDRRFGRYTLAARFSSVSPDLADRCLLVFLRSDLWENGPSLEGNQRPAR